MFASDLGDTSAMPSSLMRAALAGQVHARALELRLWPLEMSSWSSNLAVRAISMFGGSERESRECAAAGVRWGDTSGVEAESWSRARRLYKLISRPASLEELCTESGHWAQRGAAPHAWSGSSTRLAVPLQTLLPIHVEDPAIPATPGRLQLGRPPESTGRLWLGQAQGLGGEHIARLDFELLQEASSCKCSGCLGEPDGPVVPSSDGRNRGPHLGRRSCTRAGRACCRATAVVLPLQPSKLGPHILPDLATPHATVIPL